MRKWRITPRGTRQTEFGTWTTHIKDTNMGGLIKVSVASNSKDSSEKLATHIILALEEYEKVYPRPQ